MLAHASFYFSMLGAKFVALMSDIQSYSPSVETTSALPAAQSRFIDAQSEGSHNRGNQCTWEVFLMLWGTDSRQFVAAFICLEEGY
jgi:hypothetical protein